MIKYSENYKMQETEVECECGRISCIAHGYTKSVYCKCGIQVWPKQGEKAQDMSDPFKRKSPSNPTTGAHMQDEKFTPTTNPDATTPASDTFKSVLKQAKCLNCGAGLLIESIKTRLCPTCERDLERTSRLTGVKHDAAKPRHSLLPHSIDDIIAVLEYGAAKYGERNWELGMEWSRPWNAALRHLWAWWRGEECDKESGLPHLAHAAVNCMFLLDYAKRGLGRDDRP